jgi:hypothetical protein
MSRLRRTPSFLTRLVAGTGVALVLLLSVLASCPEAHEWIHGDGGCATNNANPGGSVGRLLNVLGASPGARMWIDSHCGRAAHSANTGCAHHHDPANPDDDGCIVTLFAHGIVTATVFAALVVALFRLRAVTVPPHTAPRLPAPHYLLPPLCGPPGS